MNNVEKGKRGEEIVERYLIENGFKILAKNYRAGKNEIDLIAKLDDVIVFVEVKYRKSEHYGRGFDSINLKKIKSISRVARVFMLKNKYTNCNIRFDVASIDGGELVYYKNAFNMIY